MCLTKLEVNRKYYELTKRPFKGSRYETQAVPSSNLACYLKGNDPVFVFEPDVALILESVIIEDKPISFARGGMEGLFTVPIAEGGGISRATFSLAFYYFGEVSRGLEVLTSREARSHRDVVQQMAVGWRLKSLDPVVLVSRDGKRELNSWKISVEAPEQLVKGPFNLFSPEERKTCQLAKIVITEDDQKQYFHVGATSICGGRADGCFAFDRHPDAPASHLTVEEYRIVQRHIEQECSFSL